MSKNIALYARVSTRDKNQDPLSQLLPLREWAKAQGYEIVKEYVDHDSGTKGTSGRAQFDELFRDAHRRKFDLVAFWAIDRFSREGMTKTVLHLERLSSYGVSFHSYTEPALSTDNETVRDILLAIFAALAQMEAKRVSDRVKAGLDRTRLKGTKLGRPGVAERHRSAIEELVKEKKSVREIANILGIPSSTIAPLIKTTREELSKER